MTYFIAEICSNHLNDLKRCKKMIDEAKNIGEAKILFESLSKTLVSSSPAKRGGNLTEGAIRPKTGSASAPVKSAQPLNESLALDRWATLAGIKK